jgi:PilZ domain
MTEALVESVRSRLKGAPNVEVTVWDPSDDNIELHFMASVKMVLGDRFRLTWAGALIPKGLNASCLQPSLKIGVLLDDSEPLILIYPKVLMAPLPNQWTTETSVGFKLDFWVSLDNQTEIETIQRRKFVRIPVDVPVEVLDPKSSPEHVNHGRSVNMSAGGLRFFSNEEFPPETIVSLNIFLIPHQPPLTVKVRVVLCMEESMVLQKERNFKISGQFIELQPKYEAMIMKECFRIELSRAGNQ